MSVKLLVWFALLPAIPVESFAREFPSETVCVDTNAPERHNTQDGDSAEHRCLQAWEAATRAKGDHRLELYQIDLRLASLYETRDQYIEAAKYYQFAYEVAKILFGERSEEVVLTLNGIGEMRLEQGRIREADRSFHQALNILEGNTNAKRANIAAALNNLAAVQHATGNLFQTLALMRRVVAIFQADPSADEEALGAALANLATILLETGAHTEAMIYAERAVSILERHKDSNRLPVSLITLGRLQMEAGDTAIAETTLQRALDSVKDPDKTDNVTVALAFTHLAVLYGITGRYTEANWYFLRAIEMNQRLLGPDNPVLLDSMGAYADFLRATKRKREAKKLEAYIREHQENYREQNPSVGNVVDVSTLLRQSSQ